MGKKSKKVLNCDSCGKTFMHIRTLISHKKYDHNETKKQENISAAKTNEKHQQTNNEKLMQTDHNDDSNEPGTHCIDQDEFNITESYQKDENNQKIENAQESGNDKVDENDQVAEKDQKGKNDHNDTKKQENIAVKAAKKDKENETDQANENDQKVYPMDEPDKDFISNQLKSLDCDICDKKFSDLSSLESHLAHEHLNDMTNDMTNEITNDTTNDITNEITNDTTKNIPIYDMTNDNAMIEAQIEIDFEPLPENKATQNSIPSKSESSIEKAINEYNCLLCGKTYVQCSNLQYHMKIYEVLKQYKCNRCGKKFDDNLGLKRHFKIIHDNTNGISNGFKSNDFDFEPPTKQINPMNLLEMQLKNNPGGPNPNRCDQCGKSYKNRISLRMHVKTVHMGVKEFCKFCDKTFTQSHNLKQHVKKVHGEEFLFPNTTTTTTNITEFKQHHQNENAEPEFDYEELFDSNSSIKSSSSETEETSSENDEEEGNIMHSYDENTPPVTTTQNEFLQFLQLGPHPVIPSPIKLKQLTRGSAQWKCPCCDDKITKNRNDMVRHIRTHTREKPFSCEFCEFSSSQKGHLTDHMKKIHERQKPDFKMQRKEENSYLFGGEKNSNVFEFEPASTQQIETMNNWEENSGIRMKICDHCGNSFKTRKSLRRHAKNIHQIILPWAQPNFHPSTYTNKKKLISNRKKRCGECDACHRNNCGQCEYCQDKPQFGGPGQKRHACINRKCMILQDQNIKHECHICGKNFRNGYPLKLHVRTVHEGIKSFECLSCDRAFGSKNALKYHIKGCGKEESIEVKKKRDKNRCRWCAKGFTAPQTLKQHIKTVHEGVKSFICPSCGKAFSIGQNMKRHIKIHHKEQIFSVESSEAIFDASNPETDFYEPELDNFENKILGKAVQPPFVENEKSIIHSGPKTNHELNNLLATLVERYQLEKVKNPNKEGKYAHRCDWNAVLQEWNMMTGQNIPDSITIAKKWTNLKQQMKKKIMTYNQEVPEFKCYLCHKVYSHAHILRNHIEYVHEGKISDVHEGKTSDVVHEEGENTYAEENEQKSPIKVEKEPELGHIENDETLAKEDIKPKIEPINASSSILETTTPRHKVYVCDDCDEEFEDKPSLKNHKSEHVKVYICDDCDEEFEDKPTLKQHKSDKHN